VQLPALDLGEPHALADGQLLAVQGTAENAAHVAGDPVEADGAGGACVWARSFSSTFATFRVRISRGPSVHEGGHAGPQRLVEEFRAGYVVGIEGEPLAQLEARALGRASEGASRARVFRD